MRWVVGRAASSALPPAVAQVPHLAAIFLASTRTRTSAAVIPATAVTAVVIAIN
jgi:hypothetical protein